jgi:hypothetical protein
VGASVHSEIPRIVLSLPLDLRDRGASGQGEGSEEGRREWFVL